VPSLCSLLSARIVLPEGGATEFASGRAAYPALPEALARRVQHLVVVHDFSWSRDQIRPGFFTAEERAVYPPVRYPLVRANPVNGKKSLFLGAHASYIEGMSIDEGRALLKELLDHVTQPAFCYRQEWRIVT
jgi:alpha-ketoglutarate-dependent 2,4-dichlorophenoxyacetate dioxygenase